MKKVRAGGGVVWRRAPRTGDRVGTDPEDGVEVLLVHRPRYDDWSFPKGKLDKDEKYRDGAVREVHEETGLEVELGPELDSARYVDGCGRPKKVRYWAMTVRDGAFRPNDEVDRVVWVAIDKAAARLTYAFDAEVLDSFVERVLGTG